MAELDFDRSDTINMYEFYSNGETATANDEDDGAEQASNQQGSNHFLYLKIRHALMVKMNRLRMLELLVTMVEAMTTTFSAIMMRTMMVRLPKQNLHHI